MYVKDYEFIYNVDALFQKEVIIYGAGQYGKRMADFLDDLEVSFRCFCDRDRDKKEYLGHPVISIEELKTKTDDEDCFIIIGSTDFCQEIAEELQQNQIHAFVCTGHGLRVGIGLNLNNERIPKEFAADFIRRRDIWRKSIRAGVRSSLCVDLCRMPEPILVYQSGKVASTTICKTLREAKLDVVHVHYIYKDAIRERKDFIVENVSHEDKIYLADQIKNRKNGVKIITAVREPISRALSDFMQEFCYDFIDGGYTDCDIEKNALASMQEALEENFEFQWFDHELKRLTGVDIFAYAFDKEHGYACIKKDNIEILVLKVEKLNENAGIIGKFVGKPDLKIVNDNRGEDKHCKYIYEELRRKIRIPRTLIEQQYKNNKRMDHFYTEEEKAVFLQKWSNNIADH